MRFPICQSSGKHTLILSSFFPSTLPYESHPIKLALAKMSLAIHRTRSCKRLTILTTSHNSRKSNNSDIVRIDETLRVDGFELEDEVVAVSDICKTKSMPFFFGGSSVHNHQASSSPMVHGKEIQVLSKCFGTTVRYPLCRYKKSPLENCTHQRSRT